MGGLPSRGCVTPAPVLPRVGLPPAAHPTPLGGQRPLPGESRPVLPGQQVACAHSLPPPLRLVSPGPWGWNSAPFKGPRNQKRLLETLNGNREQPAPGSRGKISWRTAGSPGPGHRLAAQSQREGALVAGRGAATRGITTSTGHARLVLPGDMQQEVPKKEGLWGSAAGKGLD